VLVDSAGCCKATRRQPEGNQLERPHVASRLTYWAADA
jgi:hypothetical protein